ncbi:hypothetical protein GWK47_026476 [Chionoecetes opilio]|uniref:Uncharacterized protein n=1 Tax=Chionoecetes opilio TaxID=41210 RepID=A0A8J8WA86_CHIOP|nr:hypothetical protein GWK47_026476 [Chionoecetes opilio]
MHSSRCCMFVLGYLTLIVVVNHRPLLAILSDRTPDSVPNPRLFRLKERTLRYHFTIQHTNGKWHRGPDAMSRFPPHVPHNPARIAASPESPDVVQAVSTTAIALLLEACHDGVIFWSQLVSEGDRDVTYTSLLHMIQEGFPPQRQDATTPSSHSGVFVTACVQWTAA